MPEASAYIRNVVSAVKGGTLASETVIPAGFIYEKMTKPDGGWLPVVGVTRTQPDCMLAPSPEVRRRRELRGGIEYSKVERVCPFALRVIGDPAVVVVPLLKNCTVPARVLSVGLMSTTCVVQPKPSAKCGNTIGAVDDVVVSATGSVVIRNSER